MAVTIPDALVVPRLNAVPPAGVTETLPPDMPDPDVESSLTVNVFVLNATVVGELTETLVWVAARPASW